MKMIDTQLGERPQNVAVAGRPRADLWDARKHLPLILSVLALTAKLLAAEPAWFSEIKSAYTREIKSPKDQPPQPPVAAWIPSAEYGYGEWRSPWKGVAIVWDEVNGEALFLCGHQGGRPNGEAGSWALTDEGKTWRECKWESPTFELLRASALAVRTPAKDAEAAARGIFYAALTTENEATAVKNMPAELTEDALHRDEEFSGRLGAARGEDWEKEAIARAVPLSERATIALKSAHNAFAAGRIDAAVLALCFDAQWALDEAADCLASSPPPRENPSVIFDPATKSIVLFGGSHHDFMRNDTWLYDCTRKTWRQVWPKIAPTARMGAIFTRGADGKLTLTGGQTVLDKMVYQKGEKAAPAGEWTFDPTSAEWTPNDDATKAASAPAGTRIYRTIVRAYDPRWYDAAPRGDRTATEAWLAKLPANVWTAVPAAPALAPERDWGTAVFDPDRDCVYRWTGGHCADPSSAMTTYHPAINRWSIPYVPDIIASRKGITFTARPDCANHTYLHYAFDPLARRVICLSHGGTGVFDPARGDFEFTAPQPFNRHIYCTCAVGTPRGVLVWTQNGKFYRFDHAAREWQPFPTTTAAGDKPPRPVTDGSALCYDSKRDALWMTSFHEYQKPSGLIWRCDLKTGAIEKLSPANADTIPFAKGFKSEIRESVYVPTADLVLFNNFVAGRQCAYDPTRNRWVTLAITGKLERLGSVSDTLTWDPRRNLIWNLNAYQAVYVLKIDPPTLSPSDS